jgi:Putative esterase
MIFCMLPWSAELAGRIDEHVISSELLRDNPLGDPRDRPLLVYTPPGYDDEPGRAYPAVYVIQGYTGHVAMWRNRMAFRQPFPETADAMFARGDAPPAIVVYADAWTAYGGSQFVDSPGTGRYHSYLCDEVVAYVDARYRTIPDAAHRAITGKSSGGFGAMITPMLRPDLFGALATHAGDALYEYSYIPEFPVAVRHLRKYDGDIFRWWDDFRSRTSFTKPEDMSLLGLLGVAACFSARDDGTPDLPFDPVTGVMRPDVWQRWLDWDPVRMAPRYAAALRGLRGIWIDAGTSDDFNLDVGAAAFRAALLDAGVGEDLIRFELFDATHSGIDYRYPLSLAWLCERIADLLRAVTRRARVTAGRSRGTSTMGARTIGCSIPSNSHTGVRIAVTPCSVRHTRSASTLGSAGPSRETSSSRPRPRPRGAPGCSGPSPCGSRSWRRAGHATGRRTTGGPRTSSRYRRCERPARA